ncbi:transferase activity protein [Spiromyces aspiralis]|uniref:Transferase activity protein n=1 Tax=Spiromyces aspiralis TaxID=68401 RepID=A0ACC1HKZ8_9FUNG|nr:transferase activity protein [Spiromyces aspiralis]
MSSSYELYYFDLEGLGEPIRNILRYVKADWKDIHPEWPQFKPHTPFGVLPVLVETKPNGEKFTISESQVIERYLASKYDLLPKDASPEVLFTYEQYRGSLSNYFISFGQYAYFNDESKKQVVEDKVTILAEKHEKALADNGSNGHYYGDKITYLDIVAYTNFMMLKRHGFGHLLAPEKVPSINKLIETIGKAL